MSDYDVIVVGLGAMGSAALCELSRRGQRVLGLEAFEPRHRLGSSHGESLVIRLAYFEHPSYVPLLQRADELWAELERQSAVELLHRAGARGAGAVAGWRLHRPNYLRVGACRSYMWETRDQVQRPTFSSSDTSR